MHNFISSYVYRRKPTIKNLVETFLSRLFRACTSRDGVQVLQKKDRQGHYYWQAYDPVTEQKISLSSEAEMRVWLEQRYYK